MTVNWEAVGATDVGVVRTGNEDTFFVDLERGIFLVADGMGGHAAGEVASRLAADTVGGALVRGVDAKLEADALAEAMRGSLHAAHEAILEYTSEDSSATGMGTTLTALVLCTDGSFRVGHIGDSRMYVLRGSRLQQFTRDHTWVQREVDAGRLTAVAARRHRLSHILTHALGADSADHPDVLSGNLAPGDVVLLCSDGLTGMLPDRAIAAILNGPGSLAEQAAELIAAANARGGRDNITAVLVRILP